MGESKIFVDVPTEIYRALVRLGVEMELDPGDVASVIVTNYIDELEEKYGQV